jgi:LysM repeat protein
MKRFWMLIPLLLLTLNLLPSEQAGVRPVYFSPNFTALELIDKVNDLRASKNLPPYKSNSILMTIAQAQADYIADGGVITHFNADGVPPFRRAIKAGYSVAGDLSQGGLFLENIASGSGLTVSDVIDIWQADTEDSETMISVDLNDAGVGMAVLNDVTCYVLDAGASAPEAVASTTVTPLSGTQPAVVVINTPLEDGTVYHLVQSNEVLWSIAINYNTTVEDLKKLNRFSTNEIFEGQKIIIRKPAAVTRTPTIAATATFGIPTSTATLPVVPTVTPTATSLPTPPTPLKSGGMAVGIIVLTALIAAGIGSWLGSKKSR